MESVTGQGSPRTQFVSHCAKSTHSDSHELRNPEVLEKGKAPAVTTRTDRGAGKVGGKTDGEAHRTGRQENAEEGGTQGPTWDGTLASRSLQVFRAPEDEQASPQPTGQRRGRTGSHGHPALGVSPRAGHRPCLPLPANRPQGARRLLGGSASRGARAPAPPSSSKTLPTIPSLGEERQLVHCVLTTWSFVF